MTVPSGGTTSAAADVGDDPGVVGNSRLTATTGTLLTLLLLLEGFTTLDVRGYITLHTAVGLVLIGPVALKCASTIYRFYRYYTGNPVYVHKGPPHPILRVLGPLVILTTVALLGTGLVLLSDHGSSDTWITLHQASFIGWLIVTGLHFLGHLRDAAVETAREAHSALDDPARRGRAIRLLVVCTSLVLGLAIAAACTPSSSSWQRPQFHDRGVHSRH